MKTGFFTVLMFIHAITLSSGAAVLSEKWQWGTAASCLAWAAGTGLGFIPFIRTLALGFLFWALGGWMLAVLATFPVAFLLLAVEQGAMKHLKRDELKAAARKRIEHLPETTYNFGHPGQEEIARIMAEKQAAHIERIRAKNDVPPA
jgi:nucleotide-binding universal stress UspA family protein